MYFSLAAHQSAGARYWAGTKESWRQFSRFDITKLDEHDQEQAFRFMDAASDAFAETDPRMQLKKLVGAVERVRIRGINSEASKLKRFFKIIAYYLKLAIKNLTSWKERTVTSMEDVAKGVPGYTALVQQMASPMLPMQTAQQSAKKLSEKSAPKFEATTE